MDENCGGGGGKVIKNKEEHDETARTCTRNLKCLWLSFRVSAAVAPPSGEQGG